MYTHTHTHTHTQDPLGENALAFAVPVKTSAEDTHKKALLSKVRKLEEAVTKAVTEALERKTDIEPGKTDIKPIEFTKQKWEDFDIKEDLHTDHFIIINVKTSNKGAETNLYFQPAAGIKIGWIETTVKQLQTTKQPLHLKFLKPPEEGTAEQLDSSGTTVTTKSLALAIEPTPVLVHNPVVVFLSQR
jgi:hypothetical protein